MNSETRCKIIPIDTALYRRERNRLAEELFGCGFIEGAYNVLEKGHIYVEFRHDTSVRVNLSDDGWYSRFELYYKDATAVRIINIAKSIKKSIQE